MLGRYVSSSISARNINDVDVEILALTSLSSKFICSVLNIESDRKRKKWE